jgi:putative ABC transport system permease protein
VQKSLNQLTLGHRILGFFRPLFQMSGTVRLILKRQRHHLRLTLLALLNVILAVGLVTNSAFFSQAVDRVILTQELKDFSAITGRPPFGTSVYTFPSARLPVSLVDSELLSKDISGALSGEVGLPVRHLGIQVTSGGLMLQTGVDPKQYQGNFELVYIQDIADQIEVVEGLPFDENGASGDALEVWVHIKQAQEMGMNLSEPYEMGRTVQDMPLKLRVAGFWRAADPEAEFWFNDPDSSLTKSFLIRRADYINFAQPIVASKTRGVYWYIILDDQKILTRDSAQYVEGFKRGIAIIDKFLPGAKLNTPPLDPLENFIQRSETLTILLLAYNLPAFGILLYFLVLTAAILAQWQRKETSMLVSRGMSWLGVMFLTFSEQVLLFVIGFPLGIAFGMLIARLMGYSSSFLNFTLRDALPVSLQGMSFELAFLALTLSMFARLWPTIGAGKSSIVTEEREWARPLRDPFWHRYYLDLLLILPTYYAWDQMVKAGSLAGLITDSPADLYQDPLLILVPALFVVTACLVTMRLFSLVMKLIDLIAGIFPWMTLYLTLRQFGRQSQDYVRPLLLVIVSLSLGVFTLSMAVSLDNWLVDRMFYRVGGDLLISPAPNIEGETPSDGTWIPEPYRFEEVVGVERATRVGNYFARFMVANSRPLPGRVLAVDRLDLPAVAWFRPDLASESLGGLMNRLAITPDGVLVSEGFLARTGMLPGDIFSAEVELAGTTRLTLPLTIVGVFKYFPTVYEEDNRFTLIANLDYLASMYGLTPFHQILLKLEPGADVAEIKKTMVAVTGVQAMNIINVREIIAEEQARQERVGIFGTLSIGFLATAVMAIMGLLIFGYASLQERLYRYAVLHAIGYSRRKIIAHVIMEYSVLGFFGAAAGAVIGIIATRLFIPFFRYTGEQGVPLPPLIPVIAGQEVQSLVIVFAVFVILAQIITILTAFRQQLAKIIKRPW